MEQRITDRGEIPMRRWGKSDDISGLVAFLCMPSSGYVTSQVIAADEGISANGAIAVLGAPGNSYLRARR